MKQEKGVYGALLLDEGHIINIYTYNNRVLFLFFKYLGSIKIDLRMGQGERESFVENLVYICGLVYFKTRYL